MQIFRNFYSSVTFGFLFPDRQGVFLDVLDAKGENVRDSESGFDSELENNFKSAVEPVAEVFGLLVRDCLGSLHASPPNFFLRRRQLKILLSAVRLNPAIMIRYKKHYTISGIYKQLHLVSCFAKKNVCNCRDVVWQHAQRQIFWFLKA